MPLDMPPNYNISTQIKPAIEAICNFSSTQIENYFSRNDDRTLDITPYINSIATKLIIEGDHLTSYSTWLEIGVENFDIISKITYSKKFKVKAKIKVISKFTPKINMD
ncbi:MAG: hypothetical protein HN704_14250 [Bacteroidetes bacterium]|jgi:hypothetical protein|nr:hypothetical protein [Bacteroidota bacterium]MBT6685348.1 hypothetical protein [Bacteroidota bacterium]MBT7145072.1 hypothetical protein [Bacteroidota bacterium]MBT7492757.1 hypothetical protein [Bacteroidota bacterium]